MKEHMVNLADQLIHFVIFLNLCTVAVSTPWPVESLHFDLTAEGMLVNMRVKQIGDPSKGNLVHCASDISWADVLDSNFTDEVLQLKANGSFLGGSHLVCAMNDVPMLKLSIPCLFRRGLPKPLITQLKSGGAGSCTLLSWEFYAKSFQVNEVEYSMQTLSDKKSFTETFRGVGIRTVILCMNTPPQWAYICVALKLKKNESQYQTCDCQHYRFGETSQNKVTVEKITTQFSNGKVNVQFDLEHPAGTIFTSVCCTPHYLFHYEICNETAVPSESTRFRSSWSGTYGLGNYFLYCYVMNEYNTSGGIQHSKSGIFSSAIDGPSVHDVNLAVIPEDNQTYVIVNWTIPRTFFNLQTSSLCCDGVGCVNMELDNRTMLSAHNSLRLSLTHIFPVERRNATMTCQLSNIFYPHFTVADIFQITPEEVAPRCYNVYYGKDPLGLLIPKCISAEKTFYDDQICLLLSWKNAVTANEMDNAYIEVACQHEDKQVNMSTSFNYTEIYSSAEMCGNFSSTGTHLGCEITLTYQTIKYKTVYFTGAALLEIKMSCYNPSVKQLLIEYDGYKVDRNTGHYQVLYNLSWTAKENCLGWKKDYAFVLEVKHHNSDVIFTNQSFQQYAFFGNAHYLINVYAYNSDNLYAKVSGNVQTKSLAPENVQVKVENSSCVNITWQAPHDLLGSITHYKVECNNETSGDVADLALTKCNFTPLTIVNCTVFACYANKECFAGFSNSEVTSCDRPDPMNQLNITHQIERNHNGKFKAIVWIITWQPVNPNCKGIQYYNVIIEGAGNFTTRSTSIPHFILRQHDVNKAYTIQVQAVNDVGLHGEKIMETLILNEDLDITYNEESTTATADSFTTNDLIDDGDLQSTLGDEITTESVSSVNGLENRTDTNTQFISSRTSVKALTPLEVTAMASKVLSSTPENTQHEQSERSTETTESGEKLENSTPRTVYPGFLVFTSILLPLL